MAAGVDDILSGLIARVGRVRRWLFVLSVLRVAAAGLAGVALYLGGYAWLDHRFHFNVLGRASALGLFAVMIAWGLYLVIRVLRRNMTYAHAANYIEGRHSFDQQLVAAVEYYEGRSDYPYSRALAGQLVRRVDAASQDCRFDATIAKWQGYLLAAFVLLCLGVVGLFVRQNVLYVSAYLSRLLRPFAAVPPVPVTVLESAADDIVAGVDTRVTFEVAVQGRTPESIALVLTRIDPNDVNAPAPQAEERITLTPTVDTDGKSRFGATKSFDAPGSFRYHFETTDARSEAHALRVCELPAIRSVKARISPPPPEHTEDPNGGLVLPVQPYEQEWTGEPLAVLPHSRIELTAQATKALREAVVVGPDGRSSTQSLHGADSFGFEFTADASSSVKLSGVSTDGLASGAVKELNVVLKSDEPPQCRLLTPEGDYLATDVASVPISFAVTDDFGLASAELVCELPGREPLVLQSVSVPGGRQASLKHVLELEQYDLHVGDSILFYAMARDVATGQRRTEPNAGSEVYFIEIRPYRQYWHPQPGGGQPGSAPGTIDEDLITILEYTRAVVKKTWTLARETEDRPKLEAVSRDVQYCATRLMKIRDDPDAGFSDGDKAVMNAVLKSYEQAKMHLDGLDARAALPLVQEAYRILRMFIDELHMKWSPPESGQSAPLETPERIKLQEQPQEPRMEAERLESRLKEMQQEIDALARRQASLKTDAAQALQQEKRAAAGSKTEANRESPGQSGGKQAASSPQDQSAAQDAKGEGQTGEQGAAQEKGSSQSGGSGRQQAQQSGGKQGESGQVGQGGQNGQAGSSGAGQDAGSKQAPGTRRGESGQGDRSSSSDWPSSDATGRSAAEMDARMRMLQARQKALREDASQLSGEMGDLPASESSAQGRAAQKAKEQMDRAVEAMKQFEDRLADARYEALNSSEADSTTDPADAAARRLADAGQAIRRGLAVEGKEPGDKAQEMAEQLAQDADAYDQSLSEAEKQKMMDRLKAAERLLESMAGAQWMTMSGGGEAGAGHVYTSDPHASAADTARLLARQFWSVALEAKKRQGQPAEEETSDVEFFEAENDFFEEAAKFRSQDARK